MTETTTKRRSLLIGVALGLLLSPYAATAQGFDPAKTPWGDPELRGHYLPGPYQALETPTSEWTPPGSPLAHALHLLVAPYCRILAAVV